MGVTYQQFMKFLFTASACIFFVGCAQQRVSESLADATVVEGKQYALEMAAQSPFKTVEMRWSEVGKLMEKRNRTYINARRTYVESTEKKPGVFNVTGQAGRLLTSSVAGGISPEALLESMRNPVVELPKRIASLSSIKDVPHNVSQYAWNDAAASVEAKLAMRREQVRLHRLLHTGELIDDEITVLEKSPPLAKDVNPTIKAAVNKWSDTLHAERKKWLGEVRDIFDAEYYDVRFIRDSSGLPSYRDLDKTDLSDWQRWCCLAREKELVEVMGKAHEESKTTVPGTAMVTEKLRGIVYADTPEEREVIRDAGAVRREVRMLAKCWRKMKQSQKEAIRFEERHQPPALANVADVNIRKRIYELRTTEIENRATIWMMDENCWQ